MLILGETVGIMMNKSIFYNGLTCDKGDCAWRWNYECCNLCVSYSNYQTYEDAKRELDYLLK
jgi:hypothetical protein